MSSRGPTYSKYFALKGQKKGLLNSYSLRNRRTTQVAATAVLALAATSAPEAVVRGFASPTNYVSAPKKRGPVSVSPDSSTISKPKKKRSPRKPSRQETPRTVSFSAIWSQSFDDKELQAIQPHTLVLGTHPSPTSLDRQQYFGHQQK